MENINIINIINIILIYFLAISFLLFLTKKTFNKDALIYYILTTWSIGFPYKKYKSEDKYTEILNFHLLKKIEGGILRVSIIILIFYFFYKYFFYNVNISSEFINLPMFSFTSLFILNLVILLPAILFIIFVFLNLSISIILFIIFVFLHLSIYITNFIYNRNYISEELIELPLLSLGVSPQNLYIYKNIQKEIYVLFILWLFLINFHLILDIYIIYIKNFEPSYIYLFLRDIILFSTASFLIYLPFYFYFYTFLEYIFFPKVDLIEIEKKDDIDKYLNNIGSIKTAIKAKNYHSFILIPKAIRNFYDEGNYKLFDILEVVLKRTVQYYLISKNKLYFFYSEYITIYIFILTFFGIVFIFMYTLKDLLEIIINFDSSNKKEAFRKELISIIIITLFLMWSLFFLRFQTYLFPQHIWSNLSHWIKQTNLLKNIHILFFSLNKNREKINPGDIVRFEKFRIEERLNLTTTIISSIIITIILSVILSQID